MQQQQLRGSNDGFACAADTIRNMAVVLLLLCSAAATAGCRCGRRIGELRQRTPQGPKWNASASCSLSRPLYKCFVLWTILKHSQQPA